MTRDADFRGEHGEPVVEAQGKEIIVLVTGYGPFLDKFPVNVSWSIASTLPRYIAPTAALPVPIRIVVPDEPLRVSYEHVATVAPKLLAGTYGSAVAGASAGSYSDPSTQQEAILAGLARSPLPRPDFVLHLGLAAGREWFTLERQAPRGPFDSYKDVDGHVFPACRANRLFEGCPSVLKPTFDTDDVWRRWRANVRDLSADLRFSDDPGRFLCGFIYYVSMSWFMKHNVEMRDERPVFFMHVPDLPTEALVAQGRDVAVGLVKAMVASRLKLGVRDPLKSTESEPAAPQTFSWSGVEDLKS